MWISLLLLALPPAAEPLAADQSLTLPARIDWVASRGDRALVGLEAAQFALVDPATGKTSVHDLPLQAGHRHVAAGEIDIFYDRGQLHAVRCKPGADPQVLWTTRYVATPEKADPADEIRIAAVAGSKDTLAVVDTSGAFALLDPVTGKLLWKTAVARADRYLIAAGKRCGAVAWETKHVTMLVVADIYLDPVRTYERSTGMKDVFMLRMTAEGVVFATPDRYGYSRFTMVMDRGNFDLATRPGAVHITEDPAFGPLLWTAHDQQLTVSTLPDGQLFRVRTPRYKWETIWDTPGGLLAGNETALCLWEAADKARSLQADGQPLAPHVTSGVVQSVVRTADGDVLATWAERPKPRAVRPLAGAGRTTRYQWIGSHLLGYEDKALRVYRDDPSGSDLQAEP